ncbi:MAG: hypothetical protein KUF82_20885, partial [Candidatus Thiodiazotropha sp. (ex Ctena orbiculata)]|nr:hypothetical protein [Candidatus Thiodiazotropha taylori]
VQRQLQQVALAQSIMPQERQPTAVYEQQPIASHVQKQMVQCQQSGQLRPELDGNFQLSQQTDLMQMHQLSELQRQAMQQLQGQQVPQPVLQTNTAYVSHTLTTPITTETSALEQQQLNKQQQSSQLPVISKVVNETSVKQPLPLYRSNAEQLTELQQLHQLQQPQIQMTSNTSSCQLTDNIATQSVPHQQSISQPQSLPQQTSLPHTVVSLPQTTASLGSYVIPCTQGGLNIRIPPQTTNVTDRQTVYPQTSTPAVQTPINSSLGVAANLGNNFQNQTAFSKVKEIQPDNFDGSGKTEWSDYIVHFEQCAIWNQWSDSQKAQMLSIRLRGEAQRLLSGLTLAQLTNYHTLKTIIADRYEPKERDLAYRCQFRYRKREKGESASDYGYHLNRLAQKAYPNLTLNQLEVHVIDQFINGLAHYELQKHVQFGHPKTLHEAISLATEFEALEGSIDRIKKPSVEVEKVAPIMTSTSDSQQSPSITLEQISNLIDRKLNSLTTECRSRSRSPSCTRYQTSKSPNRTTDSDTKGSSVRPTEKQSKSDKFCSYCKKWYHSIEECRKRQYNERRKTESQKDAVNKDTAYVITSHAQSISIPSIVITPADSSEIVISPDELTSQSSFDDKFDKQSETQAVTNNINESETEVKVNLGTNSCLYLQTEMFDMQSKFLLDTGSPYSILSLKGFEKLNTKHQFTLSTDNTKLTAADGSPIETKGKTLIEFQCEGRKFQQEFLVAKLQGIVGILGMDFLVKYDGTIKIKQHILKTSNGKLKLYKQSTKTCARILVTENTTIAANTEKIINAKVDQPCIRNEQLSILEPTKFLTNKGCFVARSLINPDDENVIMSVVNLTDHTVKINQNSILGKLQEAESVFSGQSELRNENRPPQELPEHLRVITDNASDRLTMKEKQKLSDLLSQYQEIFMAPDGLLGQTDLVEHEIETENHRPIKIPPRRIPIFKRDQVDQELNKMLAQGIVEPSDSPWSAPICLVKKKDGSCRFCIDFRNLNAITLKDAYPLPRIDDTLDSLAGSLWFSTLDLASGYWQIKVSEKSKKKTAFVTPHRGLYHFNVMPFGLTNAPATFQRLMERVLYGLTPQKCLCYLDDIIIVGETFEIALENLKLVFERLKEANLKLKPKKCSLFQTKVAYLGHIVSKDGTMCDPSKIEAIKYWPAPTNKSEVRSILGLIGYYRKFIPNFSERASPLTKLTRKKVKFHWDDKCYKAFQDLKACLIKSPILSFPKRSGTFVLDSDASLHGIGAVLSQIQNDEEKVIAYASRTLNPAQQQYCTTKRELLAVVTFMKHFKHYLLGQKFIIRTDHAPLIWLRNFKEPEGLIARWISVIETFDYTIQYRPGRQHQNADCLSRTPKRKCPNSLCSDCYPYSPNLGMDNHGGADDRVSVPMTDSIQESMCSSQSPVTPSSPAPGQNDRRGIPWTLGTNGNCQSPISPIISESNDTRDSIPNWLPTWNPAELNKMQIEDRSIGLILQSKLTNQKP